MAASAELSARAMAQPRDELGRFASATKDGSDDVSRFGSALDKVRGKLRGTSVDLDGFRSGLKKANDQGGELAGKIRLIALAATALSGPMLGFLALGVPAMFAGIGLAAHAMGNSIAQAQAQGQQLTTMQRAALPVVQMLNKAYGQLNPVLHSTGIQLLGVIKGLGPSIQQAVSALAPMIQVMGAGLGQFLKNLIPPLAAALHSALPVVQALASGLAFLGGALGHAFAAIDFKAAAQGLSQLFTLIGGLLPILVQLLNALAPIGNMVLSVLVPAVLQLVSTVASALQPVLAGLAPVMKPIAETVAALAQTFGILIQAVAPLIAPILSIFGAFNQLDTPLESIAGLFAQLITALKPVIGLIAQIANFVAGFLNKAISEWVQVARPLIPIIGQIAMLLGNMFFTALKQILPALLPLIPPLGQLASAILQMLLQVLIALQPVWTQLIAAFLKILPAVIALVPPLTQLVIALTPLIVLVAKLAADLAGPLLGSLANVIVFFAKLAAGIIGGVAKAITWLVTNVPKIPQVFSKAWDAVKKAVGDALSAIDSTFTRWGRDILTFFTGAGSWLLNIGKDIVGGLARGIGDAITSVWNFFRNLGTYIWQQVGNGGDFLYQVGKNIITGLWNGIADGASWLWGQIKNIGHDIVNVFKSALSIFSPSRVMADEIGAMIPAGIAKGILDNAHLISNAAKQTAKVTVGADWTGNGLTVPRPIAGGGGINIDLRGSQVMSDRDMDQLVNKIGRAVSTRILPQAGVFATGGSL